MREKTFDVFTAEERSKVMSRIRSKNTKYEIRTRKWLRAKHIGFRIYRDDMPGKPDIVITKWKVVVLINGCFWHGHKDCKYFVVPHTRTEWWMAKINRTIELDQNNHKQLKAMGWETVVLWECELKKNFEESMQKVLTALNRKGYVLPETQEDKHHDN